MPLIQAAFDGKLETVKKLIENDKVDIETKMEDGTTTALVACAYNSYTEVMKYLIEQGADVKAVNPLGLTSLHIALLFSHVFFLKTQLDITRDAVEIPNEKGETPILNKEVYRNLEHFDAAGVIKRMEQNVITFVNLSGCKLISTKEGDCPTAPEMAFVVWKLDVAGAMFKREYDPPPKIKFETLMRLNKGKLQNVHRMYFFQYIGYFISK